MKKDTRLNTVYIRFIKPYCICKGLLITLAHGELQKNGDVISSYKVFDKNDNLVVKHRRYKKELFEVVLWLEPAETGGYFNVVGKNGHIDYRGTLEGCLHHFNWRNVAS